MVTVPFATVGTYPCAYVLSIPGYRFSLSIVSGSDVPEAESSAMVISTGVGVVAAAAVGVDVAGTGVAAATVGVGVSDSGVSDVSASAVAAGMIKASKRTIAWQNRFISHSSRITVNTPASISQTVSHNSSNITLVVTRQQDGFAFAAQFFDQRAHFENTVLTKAVQRLVEDNSDGVFHDRLRDAEPLAHAETIFAHWLFQQRVEPDAPDGRCNFLQPDFAVQRRKNFQVSCSAQSAAESRAFR